MTSELLKLYEETANFTNQRAREALTRAAEAENAYMAIRLEGRESETITADDVAKKLRAIARLESELASIAARNYRQALADLPISGD